MDLKQIQEETLNRFSMTNFKLDSEKSLDVGGEYSYRIKEKNILGHLQQLQIYKKQLE